MLAGVHVRGRPHRVDGHALGVKELKVDRFADRRLTIDTAVFFHRYDAERHAPDRISGKRYLGNRLLAEPVVEHLGYDLDDAQPLHLDALGQLAHFVRDIHVHNADNRPAAIGPRAAFALPRLHSQRGGHASRAQRKRVPHAIRSTPRIVDHLPIAEPVQEIESVIVVAEVEILTERPGRAIRVGAAALHFGEQVLRSNPLELGHLAVVGDASVKQDETAGKALMVPHRGSRILRRTGDGPEGKFRVRPQTPTINQRFLTVFLRLDALGHGRPGQGVVAMIVPRIAPIRKTLPVVMGRSPVPIDVVPPGIGELSVVAHGGLPFVGFVVAEADDVRAVCLHGVQRVGQ